MVEWCRVRRIRLFSVPNGFFASGRNRYAVVQKFKNEGMLPGAPDLVLIDRAPKTGRPVAIEMKRCGGGKLSHDQCEIIEQMRHAGWVVIIAHGAVQAIHALQALGY